MFNSSGDVVEIVVGAHVQYTWFKSQSIKFHFQWICHILYVPKYQNRPPEPESVLKNAKTVRN